MAQGQNGNGGAQGLISRLGDQGRKLAEGAGQKVGTKLDRQKSQIASTISSLASALSESSHSLDMEGEARIGRYAESLGAQLDRLAGYLEEQDLGDMLESVEDLARRRPAIAIGGCFLLGVMMARFLKSSATPGSPGYPGQEVPA